MLADRPVGVVGQPEVEQCDVDPRPAGRPGNVVQSHRRDGRGHPVAIDYRQHNEPTPDVAMASRPHASDGVFRVLPPAGPAVPSRHFPQAAPDGPAVAHTVKRTDKGLDPTGWSIVPVPIVLRMSNVGKRHGPPKGDCRPSSDAAARRRDCAGRTGDVLRTECIGGAVLGRPRSRVHEDGAVGLDATPPRARKQERGKRNSRPPLERKRRVGAMGHTLQVLQGSQAGREYALVRDRILVGRDAACQIIIVDRAASRRHARLTRVGDDYTIEDLGSRNQTYVNGQPISSRVRLENNDQIRIGETLFLYHSPQPASAEQQTGYTVTVLDTADVINPTETVMTMNAVRRLHAILQITQALGRTLHLEGVLSRMLDGLFEIFPNADRALVLLLDGERLVPKAAKHRRVRRANIEYSTTIVSKAIVDRKAILSRDVANDSQVAKSENLTDVQIRSIMCVPLLSPEMNPLGVILLDTQRQGAAFRSEDLHLLASVASQAAISIEYSQLHNRMLQQASLQKEMDLAQSVQQSFLPKTTPELAGYDFWAYYSAAGKVGGDFYDFLRLPNGNQAVLVGDVSGKGVPAALMMAKASTVCKVGLLSQPGDLAEVAGAINNEICDAAPDATFVTLILCVIDPKSHEITIANAGHLAPMLRRATARSSSRPTTRCAAIRWASHATSSTRRPRSRWRPASRSFSTATASATQSTARANRTRSNGSTNSSTPCSPRERPRPARPCWPTCNATWPATNRATTSRGRLQPPPGRRLRGFHGRRQEGRPGHRRRAGESGWGSPSALRPTAATSSSAASTSRTRAVPAALDELRQLGAEVLYCRADVADPAARGDMLDEIRQRFGRLNVLVNNAGVAPKVRADVLEATEESFERLMRINLQGPYLPHPGGGQLDDRAAAAGRRRSGAASSTSRSISATVASPSRGEYCISKAGVSMATQLWAARLGEFGIPVYEVRPGADQDRHDRPRSRRSTTS